MSEFAQTDSLDLFDNLVISGDMNGHYMSILSILQKNTVNTNLSI